jgi:tRNA(His) guanylyltransferase
MKSDIFEKDLRKFEFFHTLKMPPKMWAVIRLDGRSFGNYTQKYQKPFDVEFSGYMVETTKYLVKEFNAIYGWTESDEISILLAPDWDLFDREVEKVVSISASLASSAFTSMTDDIVSFDSRIWLGLDKGHVVDYFRWRQADALRCALNGWCYWTMRNKDNMSKQQATGLLYAKGPSFKHDYLFSKGINFTKDIPVWQKRGVGIYWEKYAKMGFNPLTKAEVKTLRQRLTFNDDLPFKDQYDLFLYKIMAEALKARGLYKKENRINKKHKEEELARGTTFDSLFASNN